MATPMHCRWRWPVWFATTLLWFSEWVVRVLLVLCPSLPLFHPSSFSPSSFSPSVCPCLSPSPALIHYLSLDLLLVILVWSFASTFSVTQSTALHAGFFFFFFGGEGGSFRTVSLATWANRARARGGRETSRKAIHQLVKEHWQTDSRCTITLVFRFGPSA